MKPTEKKATFTITIGDFSWRESVSASVRTDSWQDVIVVIEGLILMDSELMQSAALLIKIDCSKGDGFASRISGLPRAQFVILGSDCQGLLLWEFVIRNFSVVAERAIRRNGAVTTEFREIGRAEYYAYPAQWTGFWMDAVCHAAHFTISFKEERKKKRLVLPDRIIIVSPFSRVVFGLLGRYFMDYPPPDLFEDMGPLPNSGCFHQIYPAVEPE